jgi:ribosomal protein L31E
MADKEEKIVLEREYIVPLRKGCLHTPYYRRTKRAVKVLREFIARHMKVAERDLGKVRLDKWLNHEINFRNENPPAKIKVKCRKTDEGIVRVELAQIPDAIKFRIAREKREIEGTEKKIEEIKAEKAKAEETEKKEEKPAEKTEEQKKAEEEKKKAEELAEEARDKEQKKESKHEAKTNKMKHAGRTAVQDSSKNN